MCRTNGLCVSTPWWWSWVFSFGLVALLAVAGLFVREKLSAHRLRNVALSSERGRNGGEQLGGDVALEDVSVDPRCQRRAADAQLVVHAEDDHAQSGILPPDLRDPLKSLVLGQ